MGRLFWHALYKSDNIISIVIENQIICPIFKQAYLQQYLWNNFEKTHNLRAHIIYAQHLYHLYNAVYPVKIVGVNCVKSIQESRQYNVFTD